MKLLLRITAYILPVILPLCIVIPQWNTSFWGTDYQFPFTLAVHPMSILDLWTDNYVGEANFNTYKLFPLLLAKLVMSVSGSVHAPHIYVFLILSAYLLSFLLLAKRIRELFSPTLNSEKAFLVDSTIVLLAFVSPVLWGYLANYFTIGIVLATAPLIMSFRELITFLKKRNRAYLIKAVGWTLLITHPPTFLFYIGLASVVLVISSNLRTVLIFVGSALCLATYWLAPMAMSFLSPDSVSMSADPDYIDHIFTWYSDAADVLRNGIFSIYPDNRLFEVVPQGVYFVLFFIVYFLVFMLVVRRANSTQRVQKILLGTLVAFLTGMIFSFGGKYATGVVFAFLWKHVSLLHFFKSFTQILNIVFVFLSILLTYAMAEALMRRTSYVKYLAYLLPCSLLFIVFIYTPVLNKHIRHGLIPIEYSYAKKLIDTDTTESRVMILPEKAYIYFEWNHGWDQYFLLQTWFIKPVISFGVIEPLIAKNIRPSLNNYTSVFTSTNSKYLLIHHDYDDAKFPSPPFTFDFSIVDPVMDNAYFTLYKIKDRYFVPRITTSNSHVSFWHMDSTRYQVRIDNLNASTSLTMREKFDAGWTLVPAPIDGECNARTGVATIWQGLFRTPFADYTHHMEDEYANVWTINADELKRGYDRRYYEEGADGSVSVCLTMYYRPQFYLPLFLTVSFMTLLVLGLALIKNRHYGHK